MFNTPNKHFRAADRYKALVNAGVGTKQNSYQEFHPDAHKQDAQNKMHQELGTLFSDKIATISVNDMVKIKMGAPTVSHYHQMKHLFPENNLPNLNDHGFPVPGYLLTVSGHMFLNLDEKINYCALTESNYVIENLTNLEPNFQNMTSDGVNCNLFTVLSHQTEVQWNIKMFPDNCLDAIKKNIDGFFYQKT